MLTDVTGNFTGKDGGLVISASDVRGEIVFFLRHHAAIHQRVSDKAKTAGVRRESWAIAHELFDLANQLESASIL